MLIVREQWPRSFIPCCELWHTHMRSRNDFFATPLSANIVLFMFCMGELFNTSFHQAAVYILCFCWFEYCKHSDFCRKWIKRIWQIYWKSQINSVWVRRSTYPSTKNFFRKAQIFWAAYSLSLLNLQVFLLLDVAKKQLDCARPQSWKTNMSIFS